MTSDSMVGHVPWRRVRLRIVAPGLVVTAALFCAICEALQGGPIRWFGIALPWAVSMTVPWVAGAAIAARLRVGSPVRGVVAVLIAAHAWAASALLQWLSLPLSFDDAVVDAWRRVPVALVGAWIYRALLTTRATTAAVPRVGVPIAERTVVDERPELSGAAAAVALDDADDAGRRPLYSAADWTAVQAVTAAGNYVDVSSTSGRRFIRATLHDVEAMLDAAAPAVRFARVHRSTLVNLDAVGAVVRKDGSSCVRLRDGREIPVSRRRATTLREALRRHRATGPR
jgi:hypothetical protein